MSKYLASIMDILNHDLSVEKVRSTTKKINKLLNRFLKSVSRFLFFTCNKKSSAHSASKRLYGGILLIQPIYVCISHTK